VYFLNHEALKIRIAAWFQLGKKIPLRRLASAAVFMRGLRALRA
jgi:hypothetical protein